MNLKKVEVRLVYEPETVYDNALLAGRTVLVTGVGQNIGRAAAIETLKQGATVVGVDLNTDALDDLREETVQFGEGRLVTRPCDVSRQDEVDGLCHWLDDSHILVDTLVNNVGIHSNPTESLEGEFSDWQRLFDTNLFGPYRLTRQVSRRLVAAKRTGCIIFLTSVHQWHPRGHPGYSASKAAVGLVVKELADELAEFGIRVNGIAPSAVATEDEHGVIRQLPHIPLHQNAIPARYIGRAVVYLAADYFSAYSTGGTILIDAGMLARGFEAGKSP